MTKKTQNKLRKALLLVCSAMLLVSITIVGTVAYLTAETKQVTNTFKVGNVGFDDGIGNGLDEADVNEYGQPIQTTVTEDEDGNEVTTETVVDVKAAPRVLANQYKLIPGHTYTKDPTVHMSATTEDAWLFVKVVNGITDIEAAGDTTIAKQMETLGWEVVDAKNGIYAYPTTVSKDQDIVVFNSFTLSGTANVAAYADAEITVQAYAVQADGFTSYTAAWEAAPLAAWTTGA